MLKSSTSSSDWIRPPGSASARAWRIPVFPGVAIMVTVLATNLVGDRLRDAIDPRQRAG